MSSSEREAELMRCPECGGECVETVLRGQVILGKQGDNNPFTGRLSSLNARTCTNCGYTRLYAAYPEELR